MRQQHKDMLSATAMYNLQVLSAMPKDGLEILSATSMAMMEVGVEHTKCWSNCVGTRYFSYLFTLTISFTNKQIFRVVWTDYWPQANRI